MQLKKVSLFAAGLLLTAVVSLAAVLWKPGTTLKAGVLSKKTTSFTAVETFKGLGTGTKLAVPAGTMQPAIDKVKFDKGGNIYVLGVEFPETNVAKEAARNSIRSIVKITPTGVTTNLFGQFSRSAQLILSDFDVAPDGQLVVLLYENGTMKSRIVTANPDGSIGNQTVLEDFNASYIGMDTQKQIWVAGAPRAFSPIKDFQIRCVGKNGENLGVPVHGLTADAMQDALFVLDGGTPKFVTNNDYMVYEFNNEKLLRRYSGPTRAIEGVTHRALISSVTTRGYTVWYGIYENDKRKYFRGYLTVTGTDGRTVVPESPLPSERPFAQALDLQGNLYFSSETGFEKVPLKLP